MNKYLRAIIVIPFGFVKTVTLKVLHPKAFKGVQLAQISPFTEITIERGASLVIGKGFKMRDGAKIRVRKGAHTCDSLDKKSPKQNQKDTAHVADKADPS